MQRDDYRLSPTIICIDHKCIVLYESKRLANRVRGDNILSSAINHVSRFKAMAAVRQFREHLSITVYRCSMERHTPVSLRGGMLPHSISEPFFSCD
ncbi:hypothetical protein CEXT_315791 [Caerostris extrusa]|uniref:Uncharacterized protein n=1 Tax=Caerostris extrusa TaxID=172846 RepID=A0AAV4NN32_CAEEX|nr:hypothetical protein CEXT_315791 [Caerostris extrusa]